MLSNSCLLDTLRSVIALPEAEAGLQSTVCKKMRLKVQMNQQGMYRLEQRDRFLSSICQMGRLCKKRRLRHQKNRSLQSKGQWAL